MMMTLLDITIPIMPEFYYYFNGDDSDRNWIMYRMAIIPKNKQADIAHEYTKLFLSDDGRRKANTYLSEAIKDYVGELNGEQHAQVQRMRAVLESK